MKIKNKTAQSKIAEISSTALMVQLAQNSKSARFISVFGVLYIHISD
jgi:hypothetical protein